MDDTNSSLTDTSHKSRPLLNTEDKILIDQTIEATKSMAAETYAGKQPPMPGLVTNQLKSSRDECCDREAESQILDGGHGISKVQASVRILIGIP